MPEHNLDSLFLESDVEMKKSNENRAYGESTPPLRDTCGHRLRPASRAEWYIKRLNDGVCEFISILSWNKRVNCTKTIAVWVTAIIGLAATAFAQSTTAPTPRYKIEENRLGQLDTEILSPVLSRDGRHLAYITLLRGQKPCVVVDGHAGAKYDNIAGVVLTADGKRVAYEAWKGQKKFVVVDGQAGAEYDEIGKGTPIFSPDGKRVGYEAVKGDKWLVVVDGQAGAQNDAIAGITFSPDGKRVA